MGKQHEARKEPKRKSAMSVKEKRAAKRAKKMEKTAPPKIIPGEKPSGRH